MKDIDFDELDKAVNSLMDTTKEADEPKEGSAPATLEDVAPEQSENEPKSSTEDDAPKSSPEAPAVKRRGRFMDIVHSSSDMRSSVSSSKPTGRVGVTIAPISSHVSTEEKSPEIPPASEVPETPSLVLDEPEVKHSDWPDPIDLHEQNSQSSETTAESEPMPAEDYDQSEKPSDEPNPDPATPTTVPDSPFLPDAKVEKRPLGSPGESAPTSEAETIQPEDADAKTNEEKSDESIEVPMSAEAHKAELPVELESNIVAVEAGATDMTLDAKPEEKGEVSASSTRPSSIPQQYKEKESTGDHDHAALYDSQGVGAPLQHPAKKKSGWLWVVWIVLLIVLGAGGAFALYTFKII